MIVPTYYVRDLASKAFTQCMMSNPRKFRSFYNMDQIVYSEFEGSNNGTWHEYNFVSSSVPEPTDIKHLNGFFRVEIGRPTRILSNVKIALFNDSNRKEYYTDLLQMLKLIYENDHPVMYFQTVQDTEAYTLYENLAKKKFITKYKKPGNFTIIHNAPVPWEHYAMSREQLQKFLEKKKVI